MMNLKYNIYNLDWKYIGCFWSASPYFKHKFVGDFIKTKYAGCILTDRDQEFDEIVPIDCFVKLVEEKQGKISPTL